MKDALAQFAESGTFSPFVGYRDASSFLFIDINGRKIADLKKKTILSFFGIRRCEGRKLNI